MKFNVDKCKVLNFNKCENNHYDYYNGRSAHNVQNDNNTPGKGHRGHI